MNKTSTGLVAIGVTILLLSAGFSAGYVTHKNPQLPPTPVQVTKLDIYTMWQEVNQERAAHGVPALVLDPKLNTSAEAKCAAMVAEKSWNHTLPDGRTPQTFIATQYPNWRVSGENISYGYTNAQAVVSGWVGSPEHEVNLVNPAYTNEGLALCNVPNYPNTVVQQFVGL